MLHNVISEGDNAAEWELCGAEISHRQSGAIKMCKLAVAGNKSSSSP